MDKYFAIKREQKFIIYGAAWNGEYCYNELKNKGFEVIAFLDMKADKIDNIFSVPILFPQNEVINNEIKKSAVVIITIANVFEQYKIADYLFNMGYEKILYKIDVSKNVKQSYSEKLNKAYDKIFSRQSILECEIPFFSSYLNNLSLENDFGFIKENQNEVTAYIPAEVIFSDNTDNPQNIIGGSMYMFLEYLDLFKLFEGISGYTIERYSDFYKKMASKFTYVSQEEVLRHVNDRHIIYNKISLALSINANFFTENPVILKWNEKGYFNIVDGHNRTCFFLTKNINKIPCKINKEDYEKWINKGALELCINYIAINNIKTLYTPIPHPYFYFFFSEHENCGETRLASMCRFLRENNVDISNFNILDMGAHICYFSQHLYRMGANVTAIEKNNVEFQLGKLLNNLLHCNNIKMINKDISEIDVRNKYEITLALSVLHKYVDTKEGENILNKISNITIKIMFWESGDHSKREKQWILTNSNFKRYIKLREIFTKQGFHELGVFLK